MILNNKVFVPLYGISTDADAIATYEAALPGYEVFGYTGSWLSDDAIHCRTMELHDREMLVVDTNPRQDQEFNTGDYRVTAFVDDRSEAGLVGDSLLVRWRLEGEADFGAVVLQATADPDSYYAYIPMQADSADVEYYVFAKDASGRRSSRPPVAPAAWYTFNAGGADLSGIADGGTPPGAFALGQNTPNPFGASTEIRYTLSAASHVRLTVYDVRGRHIATLVDEDQGAGMALVRWDGKAQDGRDLPPGVYLYALRVGSGTRTRRMVLLQ
jgi:hypothetical protein